MKRGFFFTDERYHCNGEFKQFLILLSCDSPLCATFHFSNLHLVSDILKLQPNSEFPSFLLNQLQQNIPIMFDFFLPTLDTCQSPFSQFSTLFTNVLRLHLVKSSQILNQDIFPLACYPSLHAVCKRGKYEADFRKPLGSCRKIGTRHPSLLPGIFTVFCPHGSTYFDL